MTLLKLHGSTDWYHADEGKTVVKLRHPIPLFDPLKLLTNTDPPFVLGNAAVLPSREKKITLAPYMDVFYEFQRCAEDADVAVFLGTSFRDPDIHRVCGKCAKRIPTFAVSRQCSKQQNSIPGGVIPVDQSASWFLLCTFPELLRQQDANAFAKVIQVAGAHAEPILNLILEANDKGLGAPARCRAIEQLSSWRVRLGTPEVENLLRTDDSDVRIYALGLIQDSPDRKELIDLALSIAGTVSDHRFENEVRLLTDLLEQKKKNGG